MSDPRTCPKCGTIAAWDLEKPKKKLLPNGELTPVKQANGLRCPNCNHLFRNPVELELVEELNDIFRRR